MPTRRDVVPRILRRDALCHRMRSGKPASPRFFHATSWNAFERFAVPMPSICTTMKPSSASACMPVVRPRTSSARTSPAARRRCSRSPDISSSDRSSVGRTMMPQMSVVPSRPLATKTSGARPAGRRRSAAMSPFSSVEHERVVGRCARSSDDRRQIDARLGVDVVLACRGEKADGVIGVGRR